MVIKFSDKLNTDTFNEFADLLLDGLSRTPEGDKLKIFFTTSGGEVSCAYALYELLNKYKEHIEFYIVDAMMSSGIILLYFMREFDIYMIDLDLELVIHKIHSRIDTSHPVKKQAEASIDSYNKKLYNLFKKIGLSDAKLEKFKNTEDVYLTGRELMIMFPNIKLKKYI
jgi:ATP-dependent protease ClpP protease subunit